MKNPKHLIRPLLRQFGRDLVVYNHMHHPMARRAKLLKTYNIDLILDVGANAGQYAQSLRELGYKGNIVSFEPLSSAYNKLKQWADSDGKAIAVNTAIGDSNGEIEFNIASNSTSSSVLEMLPSHTQAAPHSKIQDKEKVPITRLDSIIDNYCGTQQNILLKIDTQGYEMSVLAGAEMTIGKIQALQIEMSFVPLYKGQALFQEVYAWLANKGFQMVDIDPMFINSETGEMLQADGFFRAPSVK